MIGPNNEFRKSQLSLVFHGAEHHNVSIATSHTNRIMSSLGCQKVLLILEQCMCDVGVRVLPFVERLHREDLLQKNCKSIFQSGGSNSFTRSIASEQLKEYIRLYPDEMNPVVNRVFLICFRQWSSPVFENCIFPISFVCLFFGTCSYIHYFDRAIGMFALQPAMH
jgi:hypothetical protein